MSDDMMSGGYSLFGYIILFVIIVWVFGSMFGGGCGGFGRGWNSPYGCASDQGVAGYGFQNYRATADAERTEIINTASTQYKIESVGNANTELLRTQLGALGNKIDAYNVQNLQTQIFDLKAENAELKGQINLSHQLAPLYAQLNDVRNNMLTRPQVNGLGVSCVPIVSPPLPVACGNNTCGAII